MWISVGVRRRPIAKSRRKTSDLEQCQLDAVLGGERQVLTLENVLGLIDPKDRTPPVMPKRVEKRVFFSKAGRNLLQSLDELVDEYRTAEITVNGFRGEERVLVGEAGTEAFHSCMLPCGCGSG